MSFTHALPTGNYGPCKIIVATAVANGTHTTLASAFAAASVGDTVFLRDSVTENVTIPAGVNIAALMGGSLNTPSIIGTVTMTAAGTSNISGIRLQTNGAFAVAVTGSAASILNISNCFLAFTNNTGISFTSSSSSAQINFYNCNGDLGTTGIGIYTVSSTGSLGFINTLFSNSGGSSTASTNSAGSVGWSWGGCFSPLSASGGILIIQWAFVNTIAQNAVAVTTSGTAQCAIYSGAFASGSASCLSIGSGSIVNAYNEIVVTSTNTNAITGAGTIQYTLITYAGTGVANNTSSQVQLTTQPVLGGTSKVVQQVRVNKTAAQTVTSTLAAITTQPTTSNGTSVVSVSITPTNASNILVLEGNLVCTSGGNFVSAWFIQNSTGNGFGTAWQSGSAANLPMTITPKYYMVAGGTSAITFDLYVSVQAGGNVYVNANTSGTQLSGGSAFTSLLITEYTP